ncbi:DUF58 domain-containing protein [Bacillus sp. 31A1R]|uniref:DUF58 domain-containing protein n=1 Tax=Robertmurraya mangrovi TaxID=3098077 RepID=A0ABU5J4S8_9BACI|nr:DUF58 domain-containing protein [Bacillus sp. 31A1R]MDZ5474408.1 DUF58 domain-containing protein [Bacillus sp. 31A1R]
MRNLLVSLKNIWKLIVLLFLIFLTFSYAMFQGGFVSWFLFYSFLPFGIYGLALSFVSLKNMTVQRVFLKSDYNAGERLQVTVNVRRSHSFPLFYVIIEDCLNDQLIAAKKGKAKMFLVPHFKRDLGFSYEIKDLPRGEHQFQSVRVKIGDLLGLIEKEYIVETNDRIIVYPSYEDIVYRPFANHYDQGMTASKERVQRDTSMAIGIREYQPGDKFSWINWKATAKRNDIMTKEFEQRQSHDVFVLMDCAPEKRFEAIVSFTASIVRAILRKGAQVGFMSQSEDRVAFAFRGGEVHQQKVFYHLAKVKDNCPVTFDKVLESETFLSQQSISLMLVTSQLSKTLIEKAGFFASRKGFITIFLLKQDGESPSKDEVALKSSALARGIRVIFVHDHLFNDAFSEVNRG